MITKQDMVELADVIRCLPKPYTRLRLICELADFLQKNNPNFKRQRWLDYVENKCGPNGGKK